MAYVAIHVGPDQFRQCVATASWTGAREWLGSMLAHSGIDATGFRAARHAIDGAVHGIDFQHTCAGHVFRISAVRAQQGAA